MEWCFTEQEMVALESQTKVTISDARLTSLAFIHSTYRNEVDGIPKCPLPLDSVGTSVFKVIVLQALLELAPGLTTPEADKAEQAVRRDSADQIERTFDLKRFWRMGKGEKGAPPFGKGQSVLPFLGSLYLTIGYSRLRDVVLPFIRQALGLHLSGNGFLSAKLLLQEYIQGCNGKFAYRIISESGPAHSKVFTVEVAALGKTASGEGTSKKAAEETAAMAYFHRYAPGWLQQRRTPSNHWTSVRPAPILSRQRSEALQHVAVLLGHKFSNFQSLDKALTHASVANENPGVDSYERLSPMGAAILELMTLQYLWDHSVRLNLSLDHELAQLIRSQAQATRSHVFDELGLSRLIRFGKGQGTQALSNRLKTESINAIVAALFLDQAGSADPLRGVYEFYVQHFAKDIVLSRDALKDPLTLLQETVALFGCSINVTKVDSRGPDHDAVLGSLVTIVDDASGRRTRLAWKGEHRTAKGASQSAAQQALQDIRNGLDLTRSSIQLPVWQALVRRLITRLPSKDARVRDKIVELLGGFAVDTYLCGDIPRALGELSLTLKNITSAGAQIDTVLDLFYRLTGQGQAPNAEYFGKYVEDLREWLSVVRPDTPPSEVDRFLDSVLDLLQIAKHVALSSTIVSSDIRDVVSRVSVLTRRSVSVQNDLTLPTLVLAHEDMLYATVYRAISVIRDACPASAVRVTANTTESGSVRTTVLAFSVDGSIPPDGFSPQFELIEALCQLQLARLTRGPSEVLIAYSQPLETDPNMVAVFERLISRSLRALAPLGVVGPIVHDVKNQLIVLRSRLERISGPEMDIPFLEIRNLLRRVTESLLHYMRSSARPSLAEISLYDFVASIRRQVLDLRKCDNVQVRVRSSFGVDSILSDETFLNSIIVNLAKNAIEAMPYGGTLDISIEQESADFMLITVTDTGVGIDDQRLKTLLAKPTSTKRDTGGTGLGLLTVERFVSRLGGDISIGSRVGVGTEVTVMIPTYAVEEDTGNRQIIRDDPLMKEVNEPT